jgi:hypothetical protein
MGKARKMAVMVAMHGIYSGSLLVNRIFRNEIKNTLQWQPIVAMQVSEHGY